MRESVFIIFFGYVVQVLLSCGFFLASLLFVPSQVSSLIWAFNGHFTQALNIFLYFYFLFVCYVHIFKTKSLIFINFVANIEFTNV